MDGQGCCHALIFFMLDEASHVEDAFAKEPMATAVQRFAESPAMDPIQTANRSDWKRTTDVPLTRENFFDLLYGMTPTIREACFLPADIYWKYETELSP